MLLSPHAICGACFCVHSVAFVESGQALDNSWYNALAAHNDSSVVIIEDHGDGFS